MRHGGTPVMSDDLISRAGTWVIRYKPRKRDLRDFVPPKEMGVFGDEINGHLEPFLGECVQVFHEILSDVVHVDIFQYAPTADRDFWTFVTSGMSDLPMRVPDDVPEKKSRQRAELVISLPSEMVPQDDQGLPDWNGHKDDPNIEEKWWPLRWIKFLARFPHIYETWLGAGHSLPNGDPPERLGPNTRMTSLLLGPPATWPEDLDQMKTKSGEVISFFAVYPVYSREVDYALDKGPVALFEVFDEDEVTEIVVPDRNQVIPRLR
jgi:hypothetical protein